MYQLLAADPATVLAPLGLRPDRAAYAYLRNSAPDTHIEGRSDAEHWETTQFALRDLGVAAKHQEALWRLLASVLHLGNIDLQCDAEDDSKCHVAGAAPTNVESEEKKCEDEAEDDGAPAALRLAATLLQVDPAALERALTTRRLVVRASTEAYVVPLTAEQAIDSRDALAKALYAWLFDWVVAQVNVKLRADGGASGGGTSISILDIFGFEVFEHNSFEQLCINYTNEKLQAHFNDHIFVLEKEAYRAEGVNMDELDVEYTSNAGTLALIDGPTGIIETVAECLKLKDEKLRTDAKFLNDLEKATARMKPAAKSRFIQRNIGLRSRLGELCFGVVHYAGEVHYLAQGFIEKNAVRVRLVL